MINLIWAAMILIGLLTALLTGHMEDVNSGIIASGEEAVTLCITMLGIVTMWSGIMKIAERTGLMKKWSKKMSPVMKFFCFPVFHRTVPLMNICAQISLQTLLDLDGLLPHLR